MEDLLRFPSFRLHPLMKGNSPMKAEPSVAIHKLTNKLQLLDMIERRAGQIARSEGRGLIRQEDLFRAQHELQTMNPISSDVMT